MKYAIASVILTLLTASSALAAKAAVFDNAGFFSKDAIDKANQQLADLDQKHGRQMRVETYAEIPADLRDKYSEQNKRQFFQDWTRSRAEAEKIRGVMVLICKDPSSLQVEVGGDTLKSGVITQGDRSAITNALLNAFRQKQYDQGLLNAVDKFRAALENAPAEAPAPAAGATPPANNGSSGTPAPYNLPAPSSPGAHAGRISFVGILFIFIAIVVGISLLRRLFGIGSRSSGYGQNYSGGYGAPPPSYGGYGGNYGGGGGFGRGVGGGLLGGLLGSWIGNRMYGPHNYGGTSSTPPPDTGGSSGGGFSEPPPSDFSSGGGGASSGGGDFGSGGGGGGGGDFSSGGGDASSGGGDF